MIILLIFYLLYGDRMPHIAYLIPHELWHHLVGGARRQSPSSDDGMCVEHQNFEMPQQYDGDYIRLAKLYRDNKGLYHYKA